MDATARGEAGPVEVTEDPSGPAWGAPVGTTDPVDPAATTRAGPRAEQVRRARPARPELAPLTRKQRRTVRLVERFGGKRIHNRVGAWRRIRSLALIVVLAILLAALLAGILAAVVAALALAFHHASGT